MKYITLVLDVAFVLYLVSVAAFAYAISRFNPPTEVFWWLGIIMATTIAVYFGDKYLRITYQYRLDSLNSEENP